MQRRPETRGDLDGPPEEDLDQRSADEGAGAQQERAVRARITAEVSVLRRFPKVLTGACGIGGRRTLQDFTRF